LKPESSQRAVHLDKGVLSTVIGIFEITEHAKADVEDLVLMPDNQLIEGFLLSLLKGLYQFEIGYGFLSIHLDSCNRSRFPLPAYNETNHKSSSATYGKSTAVCLQNKQSRNTNILDDSTILW
jgi:hypothetical protein